MNVYDTFRALPLSLQCAFLLLCAEEQRLTADDAFVADKAWDVLTYETKDLHILNAVAATTIVGNHTLGGVVDVLLGRNSLDSVVAYSAQHTDPHFTRIALVQLHALFENQSDLRRDVLRHNIAAQFA